jgi:hypothetical protein
MKPVLSKSTGWILLTALVFVDALLDVVISGGVGSPFWKPIADIFGIKMVPPFFARKPSGFPARRLRRRATRQVRFRFLEICGLNSSKNFEFVSSYLAPNAERNPNFF